jgi:hypothetical protein
VSTPKETRRPPVLGGVVAGIAGTAGYTVLSSALKRRGIGVDAQPAQVATALTGTTQDNGAEHRSAVLNAALHWGYGAFGGVTRTGLIAAGLSGWRLLLSGKGKPQTAGALLVDCGKHLVYVLATGRCLALLTRTGRRAR